MPAELIYFLIQLALERTAADIECKIIFSYLRLIVRTKATIEKISAVRLEAKTRNSTFLTPYRVVVYSYIKKDAARLK